MAFPSKRRRIVAISIYHHRRPDARGWGSGAADSFDLEPGFGLVIQIERSMSGGRRYEIEIHSKTTWFLYFVRHGLLVISLTILQEFQKRNSGTAKPATSYRRKRVEKDDLPEDVEPYRDPTMTLYNTHQGLEIAVPVLLVDGYNVCGHWVKLKKYFMSGRLDVSRQKLIDELVTFSMLREVKVVAVFDAMMSGLPTHKESFAGVDIIFSGETCADSWIEKEVVALREDGCPKVWVVTSDRCQQDAAHGAIKASQKEVQMMLQEHRSTSMQGKLLKHNLDTEVVDALKNLRSKLSGNELT
ncbi:unnamed protein product [Rhodiola kirilowii]